LNAGQSYCLTYSLQTPRCSQEPGSVGLLVTACMAGSLPALRGSQVAFQHRSDHAHNQHAYERWRVYAARVVVLGLQLLLGGWILVEYLLQVRHAMCVCVEVVA